MFKTIEKGISANEVAQKLRDTVSNYIEKLKPYHVVKSQIPLFKMGFREGIKQFTIESFNVKIPIVAIELDELQFAKSGMYISETWQLDISDDGVHLNISGTQKWFKTSAHFSKARQMGISSGDLQKIQSHNETKWGI